jgi:hypothetical protein
VADRPPLSVIVTAREEDEIDEVLEALLPQAQRTGAEVLIVGRTNGSLPGDVRVVPIDDANIFRLRMVGLREARGEVVAMGEDHAVPRPDWCESILRAHAEHPDALSVAGCLVNATDRTASGRVNFLAFAALYSPPMPVLPGFPPPVSALSFKREALAGLDERLGRFETELVPRLFTEGGMVADDRARVDHYQDHGLVWSVRNAFHSARGSYGYHRLALTPRGRARLALWSIHAWPRRIVDGARAAARRQPVSRGEWVLLVLLACAFAVGGAVGLLAGPGRSPSLVA